MMSVSKARRSLGGGTIKYLEDENLTILTKKEVKGNQKVPPKIRGKHFTNLDYLVDGDLVWLTPNKSNIFPCKIYDSTRDSSYFEQCFYPVDRLGEGSFGSVLRVISKEDLRMYAMKVSKEPFRSDRDRALKLIEVTHHKKFSCHRNIVTLYEAWEEDRHLFMQMELCEKSLVTTDPMPEVRLWEVLADIVLALDYIHDCGAGHFDVKTENIQLGYDGLYKLSDFGLVYNFEEQFPSQPQEGDSKYLAPELLLTSAYATTKSDIFSLGIAILELAGNLALPSNGRVWKALREDTFPFTQTEHISDELFNLLTRMMASEPSLRPTTKEILNIPTVRDIVIKRQSIVTTDQELLSNEILPYIATFALLGAILHLLAKIIKKKKSPRKVPAITITEINLSSASSEENLPNTSTFSNADTTKPKNPVTSTPFNPGTSITSEDERKDSSMDWSSTEDNIPSTSSNQVIDTPFQNGEIHPVANGSQTYDTRCSSVSPTGCERHGPFPKKDSDTHIFPTPSYTNSVTDSSFGILSPGSPNIHATLAHLSIPGTSFGMENSNVCLSAPSILRFGLSPIRLSNEMKEMVRAKKRRRMMTPRNLNRTFDEEFDD